MKRMMLALGMVLYAWAAKGANLLVNPDFELSSCADHKGEWGWFKDGKITVPGWEGAGNAGISTHTSNYLWWPIKGRWTAFVQALDGEAAGRLAQRVSIKEGGRYRFSFLCATRQYPRVQNVGAVTVVVAEGSNKRTLATVEFKHGETNWRQVSCEVELKGGKDYTFSFEAVKGAGDRTLNLECVSLVRAETPLAEFKPIGTPTPTLHLTDYFRPHADPDDHWDAATQFALARQGLIDLKGVLIDYPCRVGNRNPDVQGIAQLKWITSLAVPVGVGQPRPGEEVRSGLMLLKRTLEEAKEPVAIHVVGTSADVVEAAERWPELFRAKVRGVYLNVGSGENTQQLEWNVTLNVELYGKAFQLPCPIYWMPCFNRMGEGVGHWGTYWKFQQERAFPNMNPEVLNYFEGMLSKRVDSAWLDDVRKAPNWSAIEKLGKLYRNMWCTAGFLHAAGYTVWNDGTIAPIGKDTSKEVFRFRPITVTCGKDGRPKWQPVEQSGNRFIFEVQDVEHYQEAMTLAIARVMAWL